MRTIFQEVIFFLLQIPRDESGVDLWELVGVSRESGGGKSSKLYQSVLQQ